MSRGGLVLVAVLTMAVFASAVAAVYSKHRSRELFVTHQQLKREQDRLDVEWGRLRLEQGTWATHGRVEKVAREKLDLRMPARSDIVVLRLPGAAPREAQ